MYAAGKISRASRNQPTLYHAIQQNPLGVTIDQRFTPLTSGLPSGQSLQNPGLIYCFLASKHGACSAPSHAGPISLAKLCEHASASRKVMTSVQDKKACHGRVVFYEGSCVLALDVLGIRFRGHDDVWIPSGRTRGSRGMSRWGDFRVPMPVAHYIRKCQSSKSKRE
jgi:hypothetical protein